MLDKDFFLKYQKQIVWLFNTSIGRWFFRLEKSSVGDKRIVQVLPNAITWNNKDGTISTEFRTNNRFAYRFNTLLKFFPFIRFERSSQLEWIPQLQMGLTVSTFYPDANVETATVDGKVIRDGVNETFATIRAGAGTVAEPSSATPRVGIFASTNTDEYTNLERFIALFDTSSIDDAATVSAAVFSLFGFAKGETIASQSVGIVASTPASNTDLVASDYGQLGTTRFATDITLAAFSTTAYNDFTLNATGIAAISKTGITKLGARISCDIDNSAPTWVSAANARANFYSADQADVTNDPKLVVTYSTSSIKTVDELAVASVKTVNGLAIASVKTINGLA